MTEDRIRLNREYIGKTYTAGPCVVEPKSIKQYAEATNETNPIYFHSNCQVELISPPLYPVVFIPKVLNQLVEDADNLGLDILRVVHSQHRIRWHDHLHSGDQIHVKATVAEMKQHGIHDTMDLEIIFTRMGKPVVEMRYQLLARGVQKTREKKEVKHKHITDMKKKLGEQSLVISESQGVRYAKASGDHNPIHTNEEIARSAGFPKTIVHGLCTMALASKAIVDILLEGNPSRLKFMSTRFSKPVLMGQTITTELFDKGMKADHHIIHFITKDDENIPVLTNGVAEYVD